MGKKNKGELGRSLIKSRFGDAKTRKRLNDDSLLHTTDLQDGYDWGRLNLQSVTEESSFQEFLSTAELAGTEFQAEKLNVKFVDVRNNVGILTDDERKQTKDAHEKNKEIIKIPRRPPWNKETTSEELEKNEKEEFLNWRRSLAKLQDDEGLLLTPYEKNLEYWRQLWRVVEKSDVIVQIVDARNPLLFCCEDLKKYVKEISEDKLNLILVNKADFLTEKQRQQWADYFTSIGTKVAFYSAILANESEISKVSSEDEETQHLREDIAKLNEAVDETAKRLSEITTQIETLLNIDLEGNTNELLTRSSLINLFKTIHKGPRVLPKVTTIGLVGYPNVGKSSTINSLLTEKKVSVSATPGKTKHFQTIFLDDELLLCDCPGLVMPSFVFTKAEMILNGILPIDQMRDHVPPVNFVCDLFPKYILEEKYGIMLPDEINSEVLLNAYGHVRGFMTANGQPDNPRAARYILKDFVNGKLLYATAPPGIEQVAYHSWPKRTRTIVNKTPAALRAIKPNHVTVSDVDEEFFKSRSMGAHVKGHNLTPATQSASEKPWKKINKHENKNKKEKLRRVYAHLDQH